LIVEKASGEPLLQFLQEKVFTPLNMKSVADTDKAKLGDTDPTGYLRFALGPPRPAPKEGSGWPLPQANWLCPRKTWQSGTFRSSIRN